MAKKAGLAEKKTGIWIVKSKNIININEDMMEKDNWDLIRSGDNRAFRELYDRHADMLYGYGMRMVQDSELVEDAIQNVFVNIFERRMFITRPDSIGAYLYTSLRNSILCEMRKARLSLVPLEDGHEGGRADDYNFQLEIDPCSILELDEEERSKQALLQEILDSLDGKQREIIYLRFYKGLSAEEVAAIFDTNKQQIHVTVSRIIKRLREKNVYDKVFIAFVLSMQNW